MDMDVFKEKQPIHRISKEDEAAIYRVIDAKLRTTADETKAVRTDKARRKAALEGFLREITSLAHVKSDCKGPRRLCYEDLTALLRIAGISYRELFEHISCDPDGNAVAPGWATESEAKMCAYCDMLSPEQQETLLALVRRLLAPAFFSGMESLSPINRLTQAGDLRGANCIGEQRSKMRSLGVESVYLRRRMPYNYNALQLHLLPYIAKGCDVSPHWLLGLGETATVLAETTGAELIMDLFCFLPEERKEIVLTSIDTAFSA